MGRQNGFRDNVAVVLSGDKSYNASADNHNAIRVNKGFLQKVKTPAELAFVLAHEMAHVGNRDIKRRALPLGISVIALSLLVTPSIGGRALIRQLKKIPPPFKVWTAVGLPVVIAAGFLRYWGAVTRRLEDEADARAVIIMRNAGISTQGVETFIQNIRDAHAKANKGWRRFEFWFKWFMHDHSRPHVRLNTIQREVNKTRHLESGTPALTPVQWEALKSVVVFNKKSD